MIIICSRIIENKSNNFQYILFTIMKYFCITIKCRIGNEERACEGKKSSNLIIFYNSKILLAKVSLILFEQKAMPIYCLAEENFIKLGVEND